MSSRSYIAATNIFQDWVYPISLFVVLSVFFLAPDLPLVTGYSLVIALIILLTIGLAVRHQKMPSQDWHTLLPLPALLIICPFFLVLLTANQERSEFSHFQVSPDTDYPYGHFLLALSCLLVFVRLTINMRKQGLTLNGSVGIIFWGLFGGIYLAAILYSRNSHVVAPSFLPTTALALLFLLSTPFVLRTSATDLAVTKSLILSSAIVILVLYADAFRLSSREQCGTSSLKPPSNLVRLLLAAEDPRFFKHRGVDFHRIRMALREAALSGKLGRGASTVTMQYVKVCFLSRERTLVRKVRQTTASFVLELSHSKQEILSRYLSSVPFGEGTTGVDQAAKHYFSKELSELSDREALALVLTIYDPSSYNPNKTRSNLHLSRGAVIKSRARKIHFSDD